MKYRYDTVELIQFLIQLLTYKGFYDHNLDWIGVQKIQIITTMSPSSNPGRHVISARFFSVIRQCYFSYSSKDQRISILSLQLENFRKQSISSDVTWKDRNKLKQLAKTIIEVFDRATIKFNPDIQPHYKFNPRDISRILKCLTYYDYDGRSSSYLLDIIGNELLRIFGDRLVDRKSLLEFQTIITDVFQQDWNHTFDFKDAFVYKAFNTHDKSNKLSKISSEECTHLVMKEYHIYERETRKLDVIIFRELLCLITSIERILIQPGGSMLLAKRPGIPMLDLVEFIASYLRLKVFIPSVLKTFSKKSFYADLKSVISYAGLSNHSCLLIIEEQHVYDDLVLESINSVLCSGEISDLFLNEELESVYSSIKDDYSASGFIGTIHDYFISRIKTNLHISVIMDIGDERFLSNCQSNPALYSQCQMIWKDDWNPEAERVIVSEMIKPVDISESIKTGICKNILLIHDIQKKNFATPQSLKQFLKNYASMYSTIEHRILIRKSYLEGGVVKLEQSFEYVDKLSESAEVQRHELIQKQSQADLALKEITESLVRAAEQKKEIETLTAQLGREEEKILAEKQKIETELADVEPLLMAAKAAVGDIKSENLSEIRSLRAPPTAVRDVLEGVLRLMGILDVSWNSMKVFLGQRTVKEEILNFNARNITKAIRYF